MKPFLRSQLERYAQRLGELDFLLSREDIMADMAQYRVLSREHAEVTQVAGRYARDGYENRDRTKRAEWAREIHFGNLPPVCKIRIYTLAGDLVQEIDHYYPNGGPGSQEETWNVISRNTQSITSGIYLWSVRSDQTEQLGKLVIIK